MGLLTFRAAIAAVVKNGGVLGQQVIGSVIDDHPITCTLQTEMLEVQHMMLEHHKVYAGDDGLCLDGGVVGGVSQRDKILS